MFQKQIKIEGEENIKSYEYKGEDQSITYKYFVNELTQKLLDYIPIWLSPNILSILGLLINSITFFIDICFTGLKGDEDVEFYIQFINCILNFLYLLIHKCVIKQAKRTNSLNCLVILINHSISAINALLISINFSSLIGFDELYLYLYFYFPIFNVFYFNKWEEYMNGELILPKFNGICDGITLICFFELLTCVVGNGFWHFSFYGYYLIISKILIHFCFIYGFYLCFNSFINVTKKNPDKISKTSINFFVYYILNLLTLFLINKSKRSNLIQYYPKVVIFTFGISLSQLIGEIHLSHLQKIEFNPNKLYCLPPILFPLIHILLGYFPKKDFIFTIDYTLLATLSWNLTIYSYWIYNASIEISDILFINILSLKERKRLQINPKINLLIEKNTKESLIK